jgi:hypothetical protein
MRSLNPVTASRNSAAQAVLNPPTSNTGGAEKAEGWDLNGRTAASVSVSYEHVVRANGKTKTIPLKRGNGKAAFIDYLTIVFRDSVFKEMAESMGMDKEDMLCAASAWLVDVMGFEIGPEKNGRHGYARSFLLGTDECKYGFFAMGGAKVGDTVCFSFSGMGVNAAASGWEHRLYDFMAEHETQCHITRIDLSHDFLNGEYTCDQAKQQWEADLYTTYRAKPQAECIGGDWMLDKGTGRTFQIGARGASKICRVYEKGKEQGDSQSPWVRVEVQMRNRDYLLLPDMLVEPGSYFSGAYPALELLAAKYGETPSRAEVKKKIEEISVEHVIKYASMQCGRAIFMLEEYGMDDKTIKEVLKDGKKEMPRRLKKEAFDCGHLVIRQIHERRRQIKSERELNELRTKDNAPERMQTPPRPAPVRKYSSMQDFLKEKERLERMAAKGFSRLIYKAGTEIEREAIRRDRHAWLRIKCHQETGEARADYVEVLKEYLEELDWARYATPSWLLNPKFTPLPITDSEQPAE